VPLRHAYFRARSHARATRCCCERLTARCTSTKVYKFGDCRILRGPHLPINALVPLGDDVACTFLCERRKARGTEQRRKFTVTASQSGFSSCYARRREHFNRSRESLRGPPILIRIPIFNSSEVAKISAGRKCFTRRSTDIQDIDRSRRLLPALSPSLSLSLSLSSVFPRMRVTVFLQNTPPARSHAGRSGAGNSF